MQLRDWSEREGHSAGPVSRHAASLIAIVVMSKEAKKVALSPKRREALEKLRAGGILVADRNFLHYIDGWEVTPQNFYWLVQNRLVRVLDSARKSDAQGNGHVITEKGLALLASTDRGE